MDIREFVPSPDAIQVEAAIDISASPRCVASIYRDVEKWGDTFPLTIASAHIAGSGKNWKQIEVEHKQAGRVPNTLIELSDTEIVLEERKKKFSASFLNRFEPTGGGTRYVIQAYISLNGIYQFLKPLLTGYVRRQAIKQIRNHVLAPLKTAAEKGLQFG